MERIQKILARGGVASRRAAEALIVAGRVRVNGRIVTELGAKADPRQDRVEVDGKRIVAEAPIYVVVHKPRGVVSTMSDPEGRPTVHELLKDIPARVYPVGRLDFATSGVLLATNDGALADGLLHPRKAVPKTYVVKVKGVMQADDIEVWRKGVRLEDGMTLPAEAHLIRYEADKTWLSLTITEGRNQQIRRMGEATRFPVMRLARMSFADVTIEGLPPGKWRYLTREELLALKKTYGVPRSVTSSTPAPEPNRRTRPARLTSAAGARPNREGGREREGHEGEGRDSGFRGRDNASRDGGSRGRGASPKREGAGREGGRDSGASPKREGAGREGGRGRDSGASPAGREARGAKAGPRTEGARYGGGSPGRRSYEVTEDWGGGAARSGRTGRSTDEEGPRGRASSDHGGRFGRTRTTGTAGGVGASGPGSRVKGRRG